MKAPRAFLIWSTLALCGLMVLGAMTWLTRGVLASDKERSEAEARADLEERTRLALWRMDSFGASIMLRENSRSAESYQSDQSFQGDMAPDVYLHFEIRKDQQLQSPEYGPRTQAAETLERISRGGRLKHLSDLLAANPLPGDEWMQLNEAAEAGESAWQALSKEADAGQQNYNNSQRQMKSGAELRKDATYQTNTSVLEKVQRARALSQNTGTPPEATPTQPPIQDGTAAHPFVIHPRTRTPVTVGQMRPVFLAGELLLLRQVTWDWHRLDSGTRLGKEISVQGVWMKLPAIREAMLKEIADLLPAAALMQTHGKEAAQDPLSLVSFPLRLATNETPRIAPVPLNVPLVVGWAAVVIALLTASFLVHGIMKLSERRASFVSAVTHELRTPLTTFRLYSDMLESGAVKPEKRGEYLRVLSREADRLAHLVENVLSFSRIERGSARSVVREANVRELMDSMRERLEARLASAGLRLEMQNVSDARVRVDTAAVEHILFNLIDNAAKYAASGTPPVVTLETTVHGRQVEIRVSDHGPGIPRDERGRIFRAFHKSAREAAESCPGVGLGLALSRRLAKSLGGGLDCVDSPRGACFILRLPLAD